LPVVPEYHGRRDHWPDDRLQRWRVLRASACIRKALSMNQQLDRLEKELHLDDAAHEQLRLVFGRDCVQRVRHLLEDARVIAALDGLAAYLSGRMDRAAFDALVEESARLANQHPGSRSIDGCGHAAVSASYAVAKALAGRAREAAEYAAYATVYAQGGAAAVADLEGFASEFAWQAEHLAELAHVSIPAS
jgi:hypothetical protein